MSFWKSFKFRKHFFKDIGGYYHLNDELAEKSMKLSKTLNEIIDNI